MPFHACQIEELPGDVGIEDEHVEPKLDIERGILKVSTLTGRRPTLLTDRPISVPPYQTLKLSLPILVERIGTGSFDGCTLASNIQCPKWSEGRAQ
jgi:hypothetical protein